MPRNYVPDTHIVRGALGMAKDKTLVPPASAYTSYPYLLPYALLPIYAAEYAGGRASGAWGGSGEFRMRVIEEPWIVQLPARLLVALLGALTPWLIWRAALAAALSTRAALAASWLVATSLLHVQFSTHERPWTPLVFFLALALWPAALYASSGRVKHLLLTGLCAALGFSCHQAGAPFLGLAGLAWLCGPLGWRGGELARRLRDGLACVALFAGLSLLVGYPFYLVHGQSKLETISGAELLTQQNAADSESFGPILRIGGQALELKFRPASFARLSHALIGYDPLLVALGLLGLWSALRRPALRAAALFGLGWAAFFMTHRNDHVRYLLPLVVLLALPGGLAFDALWERCAKTRPLRLVLLGALAFPLLQALRLDWVLLQDDTRALAERELARTSGLDLVAFDRYGPQVELDQAALERVASWPDFSTREEQRLELLRAGAPLSSGLPVLQLEKAWWWDERRGTLRPSSRSCTTARTSARSCGGTACRTYCSCRSDRSTCATTRSCRWSRARRRCGPSIRPCPASIRRRRRCRPRCSSR